MRMQRAPVIDSIPAEFGAELGLLPYMWGVTCKSAIFAELRRRMRLRRHGHAAGPQHGGCWLAQRANVRLSSARPWAARPNSAELVADLGRMLLGWTGRRKRHRGGSRHQGVERVPARSITAQHRPGRVRALRKCQWVWSLLPHWPQRILLPSLRARDCCGLTLQGIRRQQARVTGATSA